MKKLLLAIALLCFCLNAAAQQQPQAPQHKLVQFQMALLKHGAKPLPEGWESSPLRKEHIAYVQSLLANGKVLIAGPVQDDAELAGVVIYRGSLKICIVPLAVLKNDN